jgi:hypothetical protein
VIGQATSITNSAAREKSLAGRRAAQKEEPRRSENCDGDPEINEPHAGEGSISEYHKSMTDECLCCYRIDQESGKRRPCPSPSRSAFLFGNCARFISARRGEI